MARSASPIAIIHSHTRYATYTTVLNNGGYVLRL